MWGGGRVNGTVIHFTNDKQVWWYIYISVVIFIYVHPLVPQTLDDLGKSSTGYGLIFINNHPTPHTPTCIRLG